MSSNGKSLVQQSRAALWCADVCNTPSEPVSVSQYLSLGPRCVRACSLLCTAMCAQQDPSVGTSLSVSDPLTGLSARHRSDRWLRCQPADAAGLGGVNSVCLTPNRASRFHGSESARGLF